MLICLLTMIYLENYKCLEKCNFSLINYYVMLISDVLKPY